MPRGLLDDGDLEGLYRARGLLDPGGTYAGGGFQYPGMNEHVFVESLLRGLLAEGAQMPTRPDQYRALREVDPFAAETVLRGFRLGNDDGAWDATNRMQHRGGTNRLDAERLTPRMNQITPEMFNLRMPNYGALHNEPASTWLGQFMERNSRQRNRT